VRLRTRRLIAGSIGVLALAACGTRVPEKDWVAAGLNPGGAVANGSGGNGTGGQVIDPNTGQVIDNGTGTTGGGTTGGGTTGGGTTGGGTTGGGTTGGGTTGGGTTGGSTTGPKSPTGSKANYASDVGVTATTIKLGTIFSRGGIFGPDQFTPSYYGVQAYIADLNARGGINGRRIQLIPCDDGGNSDKNTECTRKLIDNDKVFAFVANNMFKYAGATYTSSKGVPDIGGEPIGNEYDQYPHLYNILGSNCERKGKPGCYKGKQYGGNEINLWFKEHLGINNIAVVQYNQADSQRGASIFKKSGEAAGQKVTMITVNLALPDWNQAVAQMQAADVQGVFDALDQSGNANMCKAMEDNDFIPKAKVSTISTWNNAVADAFSESPRCLDSVYAGGTVRSFNDTRFPEVAKFRAVMDRYARSTMPYNKMHAWAEEGYGAGLWFTDAALSCGADLTRACVEKFMNRSQEYDAHGLFAEPRNFVPKNYDQEKTTVNCFVLAQWQGGTKGKWVTRTRDQECRKVNLFSYDPSQ
jgi:branched-chain amino acid transport system substrate-binding protein